MGKSETSQSSEEDKKKDKKNVKKAKQVLVSSQSFSKRYASMFNNKKIQIFQ